jgi:hypothetical protein
MPNVKYVVYTNFNPCEQTETVRFKVLTAVPMTIIVPRGYDAV